MWDVMKTDRNREWRSTFAALRSPETKPDLRGPLGRSFDPNCQSPTLAVHVFAGVLLYACSMCT